MSFLGIQIDQSKKDSCHKLTQPALIKVSAVTRIKDCNSKPAPCCGDEKFLGSAPERAPAKEPNSTLTKQALIVDDFHDASSPFVRELDNNDEIAKPMEGFDLSNLHENNHESEDGSQLSFVIRKHGGKKSLTPFVRTNPEDKTNIFGVDVSDLSLLDCKHHSWICDCWRNAISARQAREQMGECKRVRAKPGVESNRTKSSRNKNIKRNPEVEEKRGHKPITFLI